MDTLYIAAFIVFIAGLRQLIRQAHPGWEMLPSLVFGAGLAPASVALAGDVLAGSAALDTFSKPDPVVVRALTEPRWSRSARSASSPPRCSFPASSASECQSERSGPPLPCRWRGDRCPHTIFGTSSSAREETAAAGPCRTGG